MKLKLKSVVVAMLIGFSAFAGSKKAVIYCQANSAANKTTISAFNYQRGAGNKLGSVQDSVLKIELDVPSFGSVCYVAFNVEKKQYSTSVYIEQGDSVCVSYDNEQVITSGSKTAENTILATWRNQVLDFQNTLKDKIDSDSILISLNEFSKKAHQAELKETSMFNKMHNQVLKTDYCNQISFVAHKTKNENVKAKLIAELEGLITPEFPSALSYNLSGGANIYQNYFILTKKTSTTNKDYAEILKGFKNNDVRSIQAANFASSLRRSDSTFIETTQLLMQFMNNDDKAAAQKNIENYLAVQPNKPAIDFSGTTPDGKTVKLSDLKGKPVYVDVWATWCAPCRREIPYLDTIIGEYSEKITFLKASIDEMKDVEKWKKMVTEHQTKAINIIVEGAWKSDLVTNYGVMGVPTFMLFDKDGKIITTNAERPSSPKLRAILNNL